MLCADAEPLLSAMACSAALLRALMTAPEAWPAAGGPPGHAPMGGPAAAGNASALATRWGRVVSAVLLRRGRELVGWLEVRMGYDLAWSRGLCSRTAGVPRVPACACKIVLISHSGPHGLNQAAATRLFNLSAVFMFNHEWSVIGVASLGCQRVQFCALT